MIFSMTANLSEEKRRELFSYPEGGFICESCGKWYKTKQEMEKCYHKVCLACSLVVNRPIECF